MIALAELIAFYSERLIEHPPISPLPWQDVCLSTLTYLNSYRVTTLMLKDLARDATDLEEKGD